MKQRWFTGDEMKTTLLNNQGDVRFSLPRFSAGQLEFCDGQEGLGFEYEN